MTWRLLRQPTERERARLAAWFLPYVLPLLLVGAALAPTLFLDPLLERSTFLLFLVAVMVAALVGGVRAAVVATVASLVVTALLIGLHDVKDDWIRVSTFLVVSVWVTVVTERMRKTWTRAQEQAEALRRSEEHHRGVATELKNVEAEHAALLKMAEHARAEAEAANRTKDEFLATLSHELRTPLTSIVGWAKMLRSGQLDTETAARAIETIDRNARLQTQLIADVLDLSRIVSGKLRLNLRPMDLAPVIEAAVDTLRPAAEAKGIALRPFLDPYPCTVSGDPDRLQQVVWNLLSNAI